MKTRTEGPPAGVFCTFSGEVDGRKVHWVGSPEAADKYEANWPGKSRIIHLLTLNAYTVEGLTSAEMNEAEKLILELPEVEEPCWVCTKDNKRPSVSDIGLCRCHARYTLATRM
jgi:hypothetical protein